MANETLKTNLSEWQGKGGVLSAILLEASAEKDTISQHLAYQFVGGLSDQAEFSRKPSVTAAALTEGAAASNTSFNPTSVTVAVSEVGNLFDVSDLAMETQAMGPDGLMQMISSVGAEAIARLRENDVYALFNSLSTGISAAEAAFGLSEFVEAYYTLRIDNQAAGEIVAHLSAEQGTDLMEDLQSTNASVYTAQGFGQGQEGADGRLATVMGVGVYTSTLAETDGGNNSYGALLVNGASMPNYAPFGWAAGWLPRVKMNYDASSGSTLMRVSEARGVAEIADEFGVNVLSLTA